MGLELRGCNTVSLIQNPLIFQLPSSQQQHVQGQFLEPPNLLWSKVKCRNTAGCGHFTFRQKDGSCNIFGLDALWLQKDGAMSGPARCVAQIRLNLERLGDMTTLEDQKSVLQVEIAMELAKSATIPVHDIRDMQGEVGKVTIERDTTADGKLVIDSFLDMPAGSELQDRVFSFAARYIMQF